MRRREWESRGWGVGGKGEEEGVRGELGREARYCMREDKGRVARKHGGSI